MDEHPQILNFNESMLERDFVKSEIANKKIYMLLQLCVSSFGNVEVFITPKFEWS